MSNKLERQFTLAEEKMSYAEMFMDRGNYAEVIHFIWTIFEICINIIKEKANNKSLYDHKPKIAVFRTYYEIGILKQDYSSLYNTLNLLRLRADFGEYGLAPKIPEKDIVQGYLQNARELIGETRKYAC